MIKPILFNTEMVRAILEGRKTVTRRIVKPQPKPRHTVPLGFVVAGTGGQDVGKHGWGADKYGGTISYVMPPYRSGGILWVRETWYYENHMHELTAGKPDLPSERYSHRYIYKATSPDYPVDVGVGPQGWRPSIHMPKEATRIFLRVTDVRVERLQEITEDQALKEGFQETAWESVYDGKYDCGHSYAKDNFFDLWDSTIKKQDIDKYGWEANPWVWVYEFERCEKPRE